MKRNKKIKTREKFKKKIEEKKRGRKILKRR